MTEKELVIEPMYPEAKKHCPDCDGLMEWIDCFACDMAPLHETTRERISCPLCSSKGGWYACEHCIDRREAERLATNAR